MIAIYGLAMLPIHPSLHHKIASAGDAFSKGFRCTGNWYLLLIPSYFAPALAAGEQVLQAQIVQHHHARRVPADFPDAAMKIAVIAPEYPGLSARFRGIAAAGVPGLRLHHRRADAVFRQVQ